MTWPADVYVGVVHLIVDCHHHHIRSALQRIAQHKVNAFKTQLPRNTSVIRRKRIHDGDPRSPFKRLPEVGDWLCQSPPQVSRSIESFLNQVRLSEGSEHSATSSASYRKPSFPKEQVRFLYFFQRTHVPRRTRFLNVLREASPLAAFRRKRTSFGKLHLWRLAERPSGSFTSGGFPKEANLF